MSFLFGQQQNPNKLLANTIVNSNTLLELFTYAVETDESENPIFRMYTDDKANTREKYIELSKAWNVNSGEREKKCLSKKKIEFKEELEKNELSALSKIVKLCSSSVYITNISDDIKLLHKRWYLNLIFLKACEDIIEFLKQFESHLDREMTQFILFDYKVLDIETSESFSFKDKNIEDLETKVKDVKNKIMNIVRNLKYFESYLNLVNSYIYFLIKGLPKLLEQETIREYLKNKAQYLRTSGMIRELSSNLREASLSNSPQKGETPFFFMNDFIFNVTQNLEEFITWNNDLLSFKNIDFENSPIKFIANVIKLEYSSSIKVCEDILNVNKQELTELPKQLLVIGSLEMKETERISENFNPENKKDNRTPPNQYIY
jgi:hypothetical protein